MILPPNFDEASWRRYVGNLRKAAALADGDRGADYLNAGDLKQLEEDGHIKVAWTSPPAVVDITEKGREALQRAEELGWEPPHISPGSL